MEMKRSYLMNDWNREIEEAIQAGRSAMQALDDAERNISSARSFGVWDMLGGGFISSMLKHSKTDEAQRCIERAQYALQNFRKELSDIQMEADLKVNSDGLTKFFDIWCDNFLVDLMVQSKIKKAQETIRQAKRNVQEMISRLEQMR
jgi:hypothetical protein